MKATIELLRSQVLPDFPSGSSINYYNEKFYLVGDDANYVLILDAQYQQVDKIMLFDYPQQRIPKPVKADLETSVILPLAGKPHLLVFGSASLEERKRMILIPLMTTDYKRFYPESYGDDFFDQLKNEGITQMNIEGATIIGEQLVLANRGNNTHTENQLIMVHPEFWKEGMPCQLTISRVSIPSLTKNFPGISELCYVASRDLLLVTITSEATSNAYEDGEIADSYIGWIAHAAEKIKAPTIALDGVLNLPATDPVFLHQKIEGVCVAQESADALFLHMVADNDQGETSLFNVKMIFSEEK
ncbi:DUF6929 family protein [Chitinophaga sp. MM2321]|uniref:DUF6929 family protein n=1 Tax=Chitinophaga sp. MM2321 TaxID=3137178 RepID=UPI0032D579FE